MKTYPDYEGILRIAEEKKPAVIPVAYEMLADLKTPIEVLKILKNVSRHVFLLESAEDNKNWGRYTFLGYDPRMCLTCRDHEFTIQDGAKAVTKTVEHPGDEIRKILKDYQSIPVENMPPFTGGLVGYFSYDYIKYSEPSLEQGGLGEPDEDGFQDLDLMLFDKVICFDNFRQKLILITNLKTGIGKESAAEDGARLREKLADAYDFAVRELSSMRQLILQGEPKAEEPLRLKTDFQPLFTGEQYCDMVQKGKAYIREGDIFQVVLSNRMEAKMEGSLLDTYRILRTKNPSPYMFYFSGSDLEIVGASPETLVKLEKGKLYTFPLAGTRPRGKSMQEDEALEKELLADEKERAEHNMLVDLGRNDIGRISRIGSVKVERYMDILRFSHVMHIGSTVSGQLRKDMDSLSAVDAILPAGTLSGAPKIRACEIIGELEGARRGIYGGAVGYLDFTGNLDTCIAIRLAFAKNGKVYVRSGAGIVADSVP
ncbi:MAG: chorismate-binding protein, partial [Lachnospiraceae bacterium]|nr:chorismate-binding protein [Lachnospiraceae bacterium]